MDKVFQFTAFYYTEQSTHILEVLSIYTARLLHLMKFEQAKRAFKMFNKLKSEMKKPIPFLILEKNKLNKAKFFFIKMKYIQSKEVMKEF